MVSMGQLSGKVVAVTGGASGIGEATVRRFIAEGAQVAFADRDVERGQRVAAEIEASGGHVVFVETHVEQEAEVAAFIQSAVDHFGQLNILVNNAGIRMYHTVVEASAESWHTILDVNLLGYVFGAKAAVAGLTRGLAMDHAVDGIRVNAVCPGPILTPFHERCIAAAVKTLDEYRAESSARTMLKRPGTPQEVAACVLFLASEEASYVTGTCLFVDGGFTAL